MTKSADQAVGAANSSGWTKDNPFVRILRDAQALREQRRERREVYERIFRARWERTARSLRANQLP
jgi:hypothetical protein